MYTKFKQRWIEEQEKDKESSDEEDDEYFQIEKNRITPLWKRLNKDGYTPLTLAAKLGQAEMFSFLLEERKITQWSFGPVACVLYPLDQVDLEFQEDVKKTKFDFLFIKNTIVHLGSGKTNWCT
jgi:hypothetical protein